MTSALLKTLFLTLGTTISVYSQSAIPLDQTGIKKSSINFEALFEHDKTNPLLLLSLGLGGSSQWSFTQNSGYGLIGEVGINAGMFFHPEMKLGFFVGFKADNGKLFNPKLNKNFLTAIEQNYDSNLVKISDDPSFLKGQANAISTVFNDNDGKLTGDYHSYWGIFFKYPHRYAPTLKLYTGTRTLKFAPLSAVSLAYLDNTAQLSLKSQIAVGGELSWQWKYLGLGAFWEQNTFQSMKVNKTPLSDFLNTSFFNSYNKEQRFGLRLYIYPYEIYNINRQKLAKNQ